MMRLFVIIALCFSFVLAGCSSGNQAKICTWKGGSLTVAEKKIFGKDLPQDVQLQEALYRKLLPVHAREHNYNLTKKEQDLEVQLFIDNYYGDEATFIEDLEKQKQTRESVEREVIYQALVDRFYEKYSVEQTVSRKDAQKWYQQNKDLGQSGINRNAYVYTLEKRSDAQALYMALSKGIRPEGKLQNIRAYDDDPNVVSKVTASSADPGRALRPIVSDNMWIVVVPVGPVKNSYRVSFSDAEQEILQDIISTRQKQKLHQELKKTARKLDCGKEKPLG